MNALQNEFHTVDVEFANYQRNNPNMDNPYARLLTAILKIGRASCRERV